LRGMRERAERIGSKFTLVSSQWSGTVITLVVPGRIAFHIARLRWRERIKSIFNPN
jgi:signal transduction histidine kinase